MAITDYVIEYKSRNLGDNALEVSPQEVVDKLAQYRDAGKLTVFTNDLTDDQVRVWDSQTTLNEYNTWYNSNGKAETEAGNAQNGITVKKVVFTAS